MRRAILARRRVRPQPDPAIPGNINNDTILKQTRTTMSENFQDADRCGECPANPENREYLQQRGVSVSRVDGRPEVAGRTTNYYACRNCGEPIDMTGTGLEGLSAPGDGGEFERAIATLYPDGDYHGAIHRITTAHNTDRAADKQRIAELEAEIGELKHKADQYDSVVRAFKVADGGKYRSDTIESCIMALQQRDELVDALKSTLTIGDQCSRGALGVIQNKVLQIIAKYEGGAK